jgi:hypothetical protein
MEATPKLKRNGFVPLATVDGLGSNLMSAFDKITKCDWSELSSRWQPKLTNAQSWTRSRRTKAGWRCAKALIGVYSNTIQTSNEVAITTLELQQLWWRWGCLKFTFIVTWMLWNLETGPNMSEYLSGTNEGNCHGQGKENEIVGACL